MMVFFVPFFQNPEFSFALDALARARKGLDVGEGGGHALQLGDNLASLNALSNEPKTRKGRRSRINSGLNSYGN